MRPRRPTKRIVMIKAHEGLRPGDVLLRPPHVAEAYVRAELAQELPAGAEFPPLDAPTAPDVAPPPGPGAGASASESPPRRKYTRRKKVNKGDGVGS